MPAATVVPSTIQPYFEKGIQAYTQGSYEYAVDLLSHVIKQSPDATEARRYLRLAIQKLYTQNPPSIISQITSLIISIPLRLAAMMQIMQKQSRQAIALYERLLWLQPRSKGLHLDLATALQQAGLDDDLPSPLVREGPGVRGAQNGP